MDGNRLLVIDRKKVRKHWGKADNEVEEHIEVLKEWIKTQNFPEMPTDHMIEFFLTNCKHDIETTKKNMELYYNIRKLIPEVYTNSNPRLPEMQEAWNMGYLCPLPKPMDGLYRITIVRLLSENTKFNFYKYIANLLNVFEIRIWEDLVLGEILIVDYKELKFSHLFHFSPFLIKKLMLIMDIQVHETFESLYEHVPQELLPSDYGGKERSLDELVGMWKKKIMEHQDRFDFLDTLAERE